MISQRRRGFTLVEVLVVAGIVAIVLTLIIAGVPAALDKSHTAKCLSNLRQIGLAVRSYAADHEDSLPPLAPGRESKTEDVPVMDTILLPYTGSAEIFRCPADRAGIFEKTGCSYFWNYLPTVQPDGSRNYKIIALDFSLLQTSEQSKIPLVLDKESFHSRGNRANILYLDGRVK